ncbi:MAG: hypothetical protein ACYC0F_01345 [Rhodanobacter sp.]
MRTGLYFVAAIFGVLGAALFIFASHYSMLKPFGMALVALSAYLLRFSGKQKFSDGRQDFDNASTVNSAGRKKADALARGLGLVAVLMVTASYIFLREDALGGGHQVWPAYAFTVSVLFGAVIWSYLLARSIFRNR